MLYQSKTVTSFRNSTNNWFEQTKDGNNVFYTKIKKNKKGKHDYDNHVHLYIRREDGKIGYSIKVNGDHVESGLIDDNWNASDFESYYNSGGGAYVKKKTLKKKTLKKKTLKKKTLKKKTLKKKTLKKKTLKKKTLKKKKRN